MDNIKLYLCDKKKGACKSSMKPDWKQCTNDLCFHTSKADHRKPLAALDKPQFARLDREFNGVSFPSCYVEYRKTCDKEEACSYRISFPCTDVVICARDGRCLYE